MYNMEITILGCKINVEVLILIGVIYLILIGHTICGTCNMSGLMEGFVGANTNYGESSSYSLTDNTHVDTSSWVQPNLNVTPGQPLSPGVQNILNRKQQPIPLPPGELDMFANTPFKPECCPNTYSNSTGCACMTTGQYNYLITRGGNNVPYSEY
jgi:hypothetical protein